jgi:Carboxypeptidase regulatory-like domain
MRHHFLSYTATILLFSSSVLAFGQAVNTNLLGTVTDQTKAAIPGATVTITEVQSGVSKTIRTNDSGNYDFEALQPGTYEIVALQNWIQTGQS